VKKLDELEKLSVRSANCLKKNEQTSYIAFDSRDEAEMLRTPNFGRNLERNQGSVVGMGSAPCMDVEDWPPDNIEDLAKSQIRSRDLRGLSRRHTTAPAPKRVAYHANRQSKTARRGIKLETRKCVTHVVTAV